ncbi:hypothetical protein Tco_0303498 [Tanacetum coccineum]
MDLKLEYNNFRAKTFEILSQTYTRYKTLLNELSNYGAKLFKHKINVGFVNSLPEKWLSFSQGLRNANHIKTLDLADIYRRFVYEDNLISRRDSESKEALTTTPTSTAFFSNNIVQDFQENSDDEVDERTNKEYLRDLDTEFHERALLVGSKLSKLSSGLSKFQPKFTTILLQSTQQVKNNQTDQKIQYDSKTEYKKIKAKLALLEAGSSSTQTEDVSSDDEEVQVKVLMALVEDELTVDKNHARNYEWIDITMRNINILLSMDEDDVNEKAFVPAAMGYDHEMISKSKDWVERSNLDSKLTNFTLEEFWFLKVRLSIRVLDSLRHPLTLSLPKNQSQNLKHPLLPLKILQGASPSLELMTLTYSKHSSREKPGLGTIKHTKPETQESSSKSVSGHAAVKNTKQVTTSVPIEVKNDE